MRLNCSARKVIKDYRVDFECVNVNGDESKSSPHDQILFISSLGREDRASFGILLEMPSKTVYLMQAFFQMLICKGDCKQKKD